MLAYLIQIDAYDPVADGMVALRASSINDERVCHLDGQTWLPAIASLPALRYDLFDGSFGGAITTPQSSFTLATEPWPNFPRYSLADARVRLWSGEAGAAWSGWTLRFDGRVHAQPTISNGIASIAMQVDDRWLDQPLLATYAGTGGFEGEAALKGQAKPLALGSPRFAPGVLIDSINNVFQISGHGAIEEVEVAFDRLSRFGAALADHPSYSSLVSATISAGQWATCKAGGLVRHGAPPAGKIVYHLKGDKAGPDGWARLPGQIIRRIALLGGGAGKIDDASLNSLNAVRPWPGSLDVTAQTTARDLIQRIARSINCTAGVDWLGKLFVAPVGFGTSLLTLDVTGAALPPVGDVEQLEIGAPFWKLAIGAVPTWDVHALGDIAFTAPLVERARFLLTETYREGQIVSLANGSTWLYVNATPSSGHPPPATGTANEWWEQLSPPTSLADLGYYGDPFATQNGSGPNELKDDWYGQGWTKSAGAVQVQPLATEGFAAGSEPYALELLPNASTVVEARGQKIPVLAGRRYFFSVRASRSDPMGIGSRLRLGGSWLAADGVSVVAPATEGKSQGPATLAVGALPEEVVWSATAPAGAAFFQPRHYCPALADSSGKFRVEAPRVAVVEIGGAGKIGLGPDSVTIKYDHLGSAEQGELPRPLTYDFSLGGAKQTSGVEWKQRVLTGSVNGKVPADGLQTLTATGTLTFPIEVLGEDSNQIELTGAKAGSSDKKTVELKRERADAPVSTGSTGGTGGTTGTIASQSSGFSSISSATFAPVSGVLTGTVPADKTTATIAVNLRARPGNTGDNTVELKVLRLISNVWTQVGAVRSAMSSYENDPELGLLVLSAQLSFNVGDTGLTAGAAASWRVDGRLASGIRLHTVTGSVVVTA